MMRILVQGRFHPSVGGIESLSEVLIDQWRDAGHTVSVITDVEKPSIDTGRRFEYPIYYRPSLFLTWKVARTHDLVVAMNVSLKMVLPTFFTRVKLVCVHQSCYFKSINLDRGWKERLKIFYSRNSTANIAASRYIASAVGVPATVIANPYNDKVFFEDQTERSLDLAYVGRLVSDKGVDLLLEAVARIRNEHKRTLTLTVIGDGPELASLKRQAIDAGIHDQIRFTGALPAAQIGDFLRRHRILVVPSLWEEPFGIVALEGAACGCFVVAADGGGLPEATGPCGVLFQRGNVDDLVSKITSNVAAKSNASESHSHIHNHRAQIVAEKYLDVFKKCLASR